MHKSDVKHSHARGHVAHRAHAQTVADYPYPIIYCYIIILRAAVAVIIINQISMQ